MWFGVLDMFTVSRELRPTFKLSARAVLGSRPSSGPFLVILV